MAGGIGDAAEVELRKQPVLPGAILEPRRLEPLRDQRRGGAQLIEHVEGGRMEGRGAGFLAKIGAGLEHRHRHAMAHQIGRRDQTDRPGPGDQDTVFAGQCWVCGPSGSLELGRTLGMEGFDPFAEIVRLPQAAVAKSFELDRSR